MKASALGRRYAGALISIGRKDNQFEKYGQELNDALAILGSDGTWSSFTSPLLPNEAKNQIIDQVAKIEKWSKTVINFLKLLVDKKRIKALPEIVEAYKTLTDQVAGRVHARIDSAMKLEDKTVAELADTLKKMLSKEVILDSEVDATLIGGMKVTVGSQVYDGTIQGQLARMKEFLLKD